MMLSYMENLPTEVLILIGSKLTKKDILNFRLVSRKFAEIGLDCLWIVGYVYLREYSFKRLKMAANNPFWRKLREIVIYIDLVPEFESQDAWIEQASAVCERTELDQPPAIWLRQNKAKIVSMGKAKKSFQDEGWEIQKAIRKEQELLAFADLEYLNRFPHLKSLRMKTCFRKDEAKRALCRFEGDWCFWNSADDVESYSKVSSKLLDIVVQNTRPTSLQGLYGVLNARSTQRFDASLYSFTHLKHLRLKAMDSINHYAGVPFLDRRLPHVHVRGEEDEDEDKNIETVLNGLLMRMHLETLSLPISIRPLLRTEMVFENCVWSRIEKMSLYSIMIHPPTFVSFLKGLPLLKELRLTESALPALPNTGVWYAWPPFLKFLGDELNLTDFHLISAWEGGGKFLFCDSLWITLNPWVGTNIGAVVRYLVSGRYPDESYLPLVHRGSFEKLGWDDVAAAIYDSERLEL